MAERYISKRVKFTKGKQNKFLSAAQKKLGINSAKFARLLNISQRNLSDWKREKITLPLKAANIVEKKTGIRLPKSTEILDPYWYATKGARKGGLAVLKKYHSIGGDPKRRMKKWREWWEKEGKFQNHPMLHRRLPFKKPSMSAKLAEFAGIMLGDGGISKYQLKITLHAKDDFPYSKFVVGLIKKLFRINPSIHFRPDCSVLNIEISRVGLVDFFTSNLGLKIGNKVKQQVGIPGWIMRKKELQIACVRGLIDTDGTVITHRYKSKGKHYAYKKIGFTSRSFPIVESVHEILNESKIKNRIAKDNYDVRIEAASDVKKYFDLFGSNNPKHLKRYRNKL